MPQPTQTSKGKGKNHSPGKGYGFRRTAHYTTYPEGEEHDWNDEEFWQPEESEDSTPFVGMLGGLDEEQEPEGDGEGEFDWSIVDVEEEEAVALNALEDLGEGDERQIGDAIQLQLAAHMAFGKAKGKNPSKGKGKGKAKGKVVRSHLSLEQRRERLKALKSRSKCLRCGGMGHWAGDPTCKFPGSAKGSSPSAGKAPPVAHFADMSDSSDDEGIYLGAASPKSPVANMALRTEATSKAKPKAKAKSMFGHSAGRSASESQPDAMNALYDTRESPGYDHQEPPDADEQLRMLSEIRSRDPERPRLRSRELGTTQRPPRHGDVFPTGQFKGLSFWQVLHEHTGFITWIRSNRSRSPYYHEFMDWVDTYFEVDGDNIYVREAPVRQIPGSRENVTMNRTPPNPPKPNKCRVCRNFSKRGSTAYTVKQTCCDCGHSTTSRRGSVAQFSPESCPHTDVDHRGSSKAAHRTFCKMCDTYIDETPMTVRRDKVEVAKKVENAPVSKVPIVESVLEGSQGYTPEQLERIIPCSTNLSPKPAPLR